MNRKGYWFALCLMGGLVLGWCSSPEAKAQHRWGVEGFGGYSLPAFGMGKRFSGTGGFGMSWQYEYSPKLLLDVEYQRTDFSDGKEAKRTFTWPVDGKAYASPNAVSEMTFNSVLLNLMFNPRGFGAGEKKSGYYFTTGAGVYKYKSERRGFIYPGQSSPPLDPTIYLNPQVDRRGALGVNVGVGGLIGLGKTVALDLRGRYHLVLGELRPFSAWGFDTPTMPLQIFEFRAGFRVSFQNS